MNRETNPRVSGETALLGLRVYGWGSELATFCNGLQHSARFSRRNLRQRRRVRRRAARQGLIVLIRRIPGIVRRCSTSEVSGAVPLFL